MADADGDFPPLFQLVGPRFRRGEARDDAVPVDAAPSRPILRASVLNDDGEESKQQCGFQCLMIEHSLIIFQTQCTTQVGYGSLETMGLSYGIGVLWRFSKFQNDSTDEICTWRIHMLINFQPINFLTLPTAPFLGRLVL